MKLAKLFFLSYLFVMKGFAQSNTVEILVPLKSRINNNPANDVLKVTYSDSNKEDFEIPNQIENYILKYVVLGTPDKKIPIHILRGIDNDSIIVIVDTDIDSSFYDEKIMHYPLTDGLKSTPQVASVKVPFRNSVFLYSFKPMPYPDRFKYKSKEEQFYYLLVEKCEYKIGKYLDYSFALYNQNFSPFIDSNANYTISVYPTSGDSINYKNPKAIMVDGDRYIPTVNTQFDTLKLTPVLKNEKIYGGSEGLYVEPLELTDVNNNLIKLKTTKRFLLLDFWGTWCKPCIELTPAIKKLSKKYASTLDVIGVSYDDSIQAVKKYLADKNISWPNINVTFNATDKSEIDNLFHIEAFPTFILIDSTGKILIRAINSENGLEQVTQYLEGKM